VLLKVEEEKNKITEQEIMVEANPAKTEEEAKEDNKSAMFFLSLNNAK